MIKGQLRTWNITIEVARGYVDWNVDHPQKPSKAQARRLLTERLHPSMHHYLEDPIVKIEEIFPGRDT